MKPTSPSYVRQLLEELNLKPGKSMGQNFLIDANILDIILAQADLQLDDQVLEIGPGLGALTGELLPRVERLVAVEKDRKLFEFLSKQYWAAKKMELIHADALDLQLDAIMAAGITKVVSNLPYSVASRILFELCTSPAKAKTIAVTLQADVAERIAAEPGSKSYGLLSIVAQRFYEVGVVKKISPNCFMPRPRVDSALLVCRLRPQPLAAVANEEFFLRLVKMAFTHRRKMIVNALRGAGFELENIVPALCEAAIDERLRPAQLTVADWGRLSNTLYV